MSSDARVGAWRCSLEIGLTNKTHDIHVFGALSRPKRQKAGWGNNGISGTIVFGYGEPELEMLMIQKMWGYSGRNGMDSGSVEPGPREWDKAIMN